MSRLRPVTPLGVPHGALASLQVFWELLRVLFQTFRYFRGYSWFPCQPSGILRDRALASLQIFWELLMVSLPQSSGILRDGALVSFQVFWELLKVLLPAFRCF